MLHLKRLVLLVLTVCASGIATAAEEPQELDSPSNPATVGKWITRPVMSGQQLYAAQCHVCHTAGAAGSPRLGDLAAWMPRMKAGLPGLLKSTPKGKGAMGPQAGGYFQDLEIERAVVYMVNAVGAKFTEPALPSNHPGTVTYREWPVLPEAAATPYVTMTNYQKHKFGEQTYLSNCAPCHGLNGEGGARMLPLRQTDGLASTAVLILVVLRGKGGGLMPSWSILSNEAIAEVVNYLRSRFGGELRAVATPDDVQALRK